MTAYISDLPTTWLSLKLGDVVAYGKTEKAEPGDIAPETWVLELEDLEKDTTKVLQRLTFAERQSKSTKNKFNAGDVLYGKLRPYLNKVTFADRPGVCTTEIVPIKPNEAVHGRYLFHWLRHPAFLTYVTEVSHGVNMPRLGTDAGRDAPFVLAPKAEQKRIADKLDTVLTRVDAVNTRLARVPPLLKRFRQSVLAAATSGRLTEDWRAKTSEPADKHLPAGWTLQAISSLCAPDRHAMAIGPFGSNLVVSDYRHEGVPLIFVREIRANSFGDAKTRFVSKEKSLELSQHTVEPGDLLITKMGDPPGDVAIYPKGRPTAVITSDCVKCTIDPKKALTKFVAYAMESPESRVRLQQITAGVAQQKISLTRFRAFELPVAPLDEQTEIVRRVETLFAFADRLEARLAQAQTAATRLTPALLAKAFRGELVPQDPNDEPAAELLRRLQAQRATAVSASKTGTGRGRGRKAAASAAAAAAADL